jgi:membrane-associated phospholipid phosphatase
MLPARARSPTTLTATSALSEWLATRAADDEGTSVGWADIVQNREEATMNVSGAHQVRTVPPPARSRVLATLAALVIAATWWLALQPGAADAQTSFVSWINDPPPPLGTVLAVTNPLFRPLPLAVVGLTLGGWVMATTRGARWEVLRAIVISVAISEVITQTLKRLAHQSRPTASIVGLDVHGYPKDPYGDAYPSAHTSVAVGLVAALWPWLTWPQRIVGVILAGLVALNRLYIGAHWPVDVIGGAAIGLLSGCGCWFVASRWPIAVAA